MRVGGKWKRGNVGARARQSRPGAKVFRLSSSARIFELPTGAQGVARPSDRQLKGTLGTSGNSGNSRPGGKPQARSRLLYRALRAALRRASLKIRPGALDPQANIAAISDLHLGADLKAGSPPPETRPVLGIDTQLCALLDHLCEHDSPRPWRLIIAGDMVDFVAITSLPEPGEALSFKVSAHEERHGLDSEPEKAVWKLQQVALRHRPLMRAFADFIAKGNDIVIIRGNHDAEWYWPEVQRCFVQIVASHLNGKSRSERGKERGGAKGEANKAEAKKGATLRQIVPAPVGDTASDTGTDTATDIGIDKGSTGRARGEPSQPVGSRQGASSKVLRIGGTEATVDPSWQKPGTKTRSETGAAADADARASFEPRSSSSQTRAESFAAGRIRFYDWFYLEPGRIYVEHGNVHDEYSTWDDVLAPELPGSRIMHEPLSSLAMRYFANKHATLDLSEAERWTFVDYLRWGLGNGNVFRVASDYIRLCTRTLSFSLRVSGQTLRHSLASLRHAKDELDPREPGRRKRVRAALRAFRRDQEELAGELLALLRPPAERNVMATLQLLYIDRLILGGLLAGATGFFTLGRRSPVLKGALVAGTLAGGLIGNRLLSAMRQVDSHPKLLAAAHRLAVIFGVRYVVMGHSHHPVSRAVGHGARYFNLGTWLGANAPEGEGEAPHFLLVGDGGAQLRRWKLKPSSSDEGRGEGESEAQGKEKGERQASETGAGSLPSPVPQLAR